MASLIVHGPDWAQATPPLDKSSVANDNLKIRVIGINPRMNPKPIARCVYGGFATLVNAAYRT